MNEPDHLINIDRILALEELQWVVRSNSPAYTVNPVIFGVKNFLDTSKNLKIKNTKFPVQKLSVSYLISRAI